MSIQTTINFQTSYTPDFDIKHFICQACHHLSLSKGAFEITFIDDKTMVEMHKTHLGSSSKTDIITFSLGSQYLPDADIYICIDEASRNANDLSIPLHQEIKTLILHGILHCLGYNDTSKEEKNIMFAEQDRLLKRITPSQ